MNGINRVFLMGYVGADPELQSSRHGKSYVRLSVATHHSRKLESGEREDNTTWHKVTVWGKNAERCHAYLKTGSTIAVEGYLSKYTFERDDGSDATNFSVVAREIHFIGKSPDRALATAPSESQAAST